MVKLLPYFVYFDPLVPAWLFRRCCANVQSGVERLMRKYGSGCTTKRLLGLMTDWSGVTRLLAGAKVSFLECVAVLSNEE